MNLDSLLAVTIKAGASDLHLKVGRLPTIRVRGKLQPLDAPPLTHEALKQIADGAISSIMRQRLEKTRELDFSYQPPSCATRFRGNLFFQKGFLGAVFRQIPGEIPTLDQLKFKPVLKELTHLEQGLILVTGPTGSGKSTTLAAMIHEINNTESLHVVTIEDPIEFSHSDNMCLINQREVGIDTLSFSQALRRGLRQDPDVIMVGEMRDADTISIATTAAETGHLVFSTLHTNDAKQSIDRIINSYPPGEHHQVRMKLALSLRAVISQRLLPKADGTGRVAVQEIMINTPTIRKLIETGNIMEVDRVIEDSVTYYKMQSLNQALLEKWMEGIITENDALAISNNPNDIKLKIQTKVFERQHQDRKIPAGWEKTPGDTDP